jgi:SAM-dependent methyltransferase
VTQETPLRIETCPVCDSQEISYVVEIREVPVHCNLLYRTHEEALCAPKADIRLGFCRSCGHAYNFAFNPERVDYTKSYENSLYYSARFRKHAKSLAAGLVERYKLYDKDIIEIGCGSADFLKLLCAFGGNRGVGFDPSLAGGRATSESDGSVIFIRDFYSERYADYKADLVCCLHVLEHIQFPRDFLCTVRRSVLNRPDAVVFFEVPNVMFTLRDLGIWDLIYEHPSYFSIDSLAQVFRASGFGVSRVTETYAGQFLDIEAAPESNHSAPGEINEDHILDIGRHVVVFARKHKEKLEVWQKELQRIGLANQRVVVWGAGSKGVTFLNTLKVQEEVDFLVDLNPHKQGMYVPGTGQRIMPPEFLREYRPDMVIVMNPIYLEEIQGLMKQLNVYSECVSV